MYDENFPEDENGPQDAPQDAIASPQAHEVPEVPEALSIFKPTDLRDYEGWANDENACQRFLTDRPSTWRKAVQRYWRDRITRRQLAIELGQELETTKNLLRAIRKAAKSGKPRKTHAVETQCPRRPHTNINPCDVLAICIDRDPDAILYAEEYRRLATINQLLLFDPAISGKLVRLFEETTGTETMLARADELKASVSKDDPFVGRALFQNFKGREPNYHFDRRGRPRKDTTVPARQASHFFGSVALCKSSDEGNTMQVETMDHKQAAEVLKAFDIPRTTVARIARMHTSDVSSWLNGNLDFSQEKLERISQTVADIVKIVETLTGHGIKPDLRDVDNVRHLICVTNDSELQLDLALDGQPKPLSIEGAAGGLS